MSNYSHIAHRVFNRPHLVEPNYARSFVGALSERMDIRSLVLPDGMRMEGSDLQAAAGEYQPGERSIVDSFDGIAVIPVEGTLVHKYGHIKPYSGMTGYDGIEAQLEEALEDPGIRGILLDINSPGGEVNGLFDLCDFIHESRAIKPIWAVADEWAASAAFALGSSASRLIAPRTAEIGSVGVLTMHVDQSQMLAAAGLDVTFIFAGDHKVDGNPFEPLPDDVREEIQAEVDQIYAIFTSTVARNRDITEAEVRDTEARVYDARAARRIGFADEVMAARDVMPAFDEFINSQGRNALSIFTKGVSDMRLSLRRFGRGRDAEAEKDRLAQLEARRAEAQEELDAFRAEDDAAPETEDTETPDAELETGDDAGGEGGEQADDGGTPDTAAGADAGAGESAGDDGDAGDAGADTPDTEAPAEAAQVVSLCTEGKVPQLANRLIQQGASLAEAKARIQDARDIRDACSAAGVPQLADKAIAAIEQQRFADLVRSALIESGARASGEEVSHHQPPAEPRQGAAINAVKYYSR